MELIKCGADVTTKIGAVKGIITAVTIRFEKVQYEMSYFLNGEYKQAWLDECEFNIDKSERTTIGFKQ